jgi:hypothetical protein
MRNAAVVTAHSRTPTSVLMHLTIDTYLLLGGNTDFWRPDRPTIIFCLFRLFFGVVPTSAERRIFWTLFSVFLVKTTRLLYTGGVLGR